jgi:Ca2+/Na+ antiporter
MPRFSAKQLREHLRLEPGDRTALEVFLWSRLALWLAAIGALLLFQGAEVQHSDPTVVRDLGFAVDVWARWDSYWFVEVARNGYGGLEDTPAFYPLYPGLLAGVGRILGGHYVLAGILVSLAASSAAFVLLGRLARQLAGQELAWRTLLFLALFPTSFFLTAVYSEGLFLLLAVATFLLAERGRLAEASFVAGLALLTRPTAFALLPALAIFAWRSQDRVRSLATLLIAPVVFAIYPLVLQRQTGDPFRFLHVEGTWDRSVSALGPLEGAYRGAQAAWAGLRQLLQGSAERWFWVQEDADRVAVVNLEMFAMLVLFSVLTVVAWRRFGAPYGCFAAVSLLIALSAPTRAYPLLSLSRFGLVVFPLFLALATLVSSTRRVALLAGASGILLGLHITQWALWQWVA